MLEREDYYEDSGTIYSPHHKRWRRYARIVLVTSLILLVTVGMLWMNSHYATSVRGISMVPTINELNSGKEDVVVVDKFKQMERGDIVIISVEELPPQNLNIDPNDVTRIIKRIIALPGDTLNVQWINNHTVITVNGQVIEESYVLDNDNRQNCDKFQSQSNWITRVPQVPDEYGNKDGTIVVPEGYFFLMGDNRGSSNDCRSFGPVPTDTVLGVVDEVIKYGTFWHSFLTSFLHV